MSQSAMNACMPSNFRKTELNACRIGFRKGDLYAADVFNFKERDWYTFTDKKKEELTKQLRGVFK